MLKFQYFYVVHFFRSSTGEQKLEKKVIIWEKRSESTKMLKFSLCNLSEKVRNEVKNLKFERKVVKQSKCSNVNIKKILESIKIFIIWIFWLSKYKFWACFSPFHSSCKVFEKSYILMRLQHLIILHKFQYFDRFRPFHLPQIMIFFIESNQFAKF